MGSKRQLARHPDDRLCRECVAKRLPKRTVSEGATVQLVASPLRMNAVPHVEAVANARAYCCACGVTLTKENMSASQKHKEKSRRRCSSCIASGVVVARQ